MQTAQFNAYCPFEIGDKITERHLCPEFKAELKEDRINVSTAYELSGLATEGQKAAFEEYRESGKISIKEARAKKPDAQQPAAEVAENQPQDKAAENPPTPPAVEPPKETPPHPASPPLTVPEKQPREEPREETPTTLEPPAESEFREQDPPEPSEVEEMPVPLAASPAQRNEAVETAQEVKQLQSLRDYCKAMNEGTPDGGSRIWALDVDALEFAIYVLNKGCDDGN